MTLKPKSLALDEEGPSPSTGNTERALHKMHASMTKRDITTAIVRMSAGIGHEINNPASYVENNLEILRDALLGHMFVRRAALDLSSE